MGDIPRRSLAAPTRILSGVGLHSGEESWLQILPAENSHQGIIFRRDQEEGDIGARVSNVAGSARCTVLAEGGRSIQTVEHLLSAMAGLGVTDATVVHDSGEVPILDGSALPFAQAILEAGLIDLPNAVSTLKVGTPLVVSGAKGESLVFVPAESFWACVVLDYPDRPALGAQAATFYAGEAGESDPYLREVAPARTYGFLSELEALRANGLALGASAENAVALREDGSPDERTPLRFANEMARHKLLDLMGDLWLVGRPLRCGILAVRPSHALNARGAEILARTYF